VPLPRLEDPDLLHVAVFGPGQGESIIVRAGDAWLVVDSTHLADSKSVAEVLLGEHRAIWSALVLTHKHADHIRGFRRLLDQEHVGPVACRLPPERPNEGRAEGGAIKLTLEAAKTVRRIEELWAREPASRWDLRAGLAPVSLATGGDHGPLELTPLWPPPAMRYPGGPDGWNRISTPLLVVWEGVRVLLGADLAGRHWPDLDALHGGLALSEHTALKVAHHGSVGDQHSVVMVDGRDRHWIATPYTSKRLPSLSPSGGVAALLTHNDEVRLTSLPFALGGWRMDLATAERAARLARRSGEYESAPRLRPEPSESWWHAAFSPDGTRVLDRRGARALLITA
jgi:hypothetical protein